MRRYYLNPEGKPCLWPVPENCLWTAGLFDIDGKLTITADNEFLDEAKLFADALQQTGKMSLAFCESGATVQVRRSGASGFSTEGYVLEAGDDGVVLSASTPHGAFNGLQTLFQLIDNSFAGTICGVEIADRPYKSFRGVRIPLPKAENLPWFYRFVGMAAKYKVNRLLLDLGNAHALTEMLRQDEGFTRMAKETAAYASARHIQIVPCVSLPSCDTAKDLTAIAGAFGASLLAVDLTDEYAEAAEGEAARALAHDISALHAALAARGLGLALSSERLHPSTGSRQLRFNAGTRRNDVVPSTYEAIDLIPKDILILDASHGGSTADMASEAYFASRGFHTVFAGCEGPVNKWERRSAADTVLGAYATLKDACPASLGMDGKNMLCAMLRVSCILWRAGLHADHTSLGCLLPHQLEMEIAELYPMERDRLEGNAHPSAENEGYGAIDIRQFYNSPLQHSYWRVDDHFMMFLQDAMSLPNAVPFSLFQGVLDFRFENAFVMAGGSWNNGVFGMPVGRKAHSLSFLHAYIFGKQQFIDGYGTVAEKVVGQYHVHYKDGDADKHDIVYGKDISFWKNFHGANQGAYDANPVLSGVSDEGLHYTIFSREWENSRPDAEIESVDVITTGGMDGRIALFGITAVDSREVR